MDRWFAVIGGAILLLLGCSESLVPAPVVDRTEVLDTQGRYTVQPYDTLYAIAWRLGKDYRDLAQYNDLTPPFVIQAGEVIWVEAPPQRSTNQQPGRVNKAKPSVVAQVTNNKVLLRSSSDNSPKTAETLTSKIALSWPLCPDGQDKITIKNNGVDILGRSNAPVVSAADGKVVYSGNGLRGYGRLIIIKHSDAYLSAYAHTQRVFVKEGDEVHQGQRIACIGQGGTEGAKLHFELREDGRPVDPLRHLPKLSSCDGGGS